jgi:hypothetical protein
MAPGVAVTETPTISARFVKGWEQSWWLRRPKNVPFVLEMEAVSAAMVMSIMYAQYVKVQVGPTFTRRALRAKKPKRAR